MAESFFGPFAILMDHLFNNQFVEGLALRVRSRYLLGEYDCMNGVVDIVLIKFISRVCNEEDMSMRQISFLKLDNVGVRVYYLHDMTFDKIAQKLSEFQLKHSSHQVGAIDDINVWKKISFEFQSVWIAGESDEKDEFIELSNQSESVLLFGFHVSRGFRMTRRQYRHFLINIVELITLTQPVHEIPIEISSQKQLIKTNEIEIIKFHAGKCIHQEMLKQSSRMQYTAEFSLATLYIYNIRKERDPDTNTLTKVKERDFHTNTLISRNRKTTDSSYFLCINRSTR